MSEAGGIQCYAVYVSRRVNRAGEHIWSDPVAYFLAERNALTYKQQLQAAGGIALVAPITMDLDERQKQLILQDYNG